MFCVNTSSKDEQTALSSLWVMAPKKLDMEQIENNFQGNKPVYENSLEFFGFFDKPQSLNLDPSLNIPQFGYENPVTKFIEQATEEHDHNVDHHLVAYNENQGIPLQNPYQNHFLGESGSLEVLSDNFHYNSQTSLEAPVAASPKTEFHSPVEMGHGSPLNNYHLHPVSKEFERNGSGMSEQLRIVESSENIPGQLLPFQGPYGEYPDLTTMINSNSDIAAPIVEARFENKGCPICKKKNTKDMSRHWRIHQTVKRFSCPFPRHRCDHKTGQFNRRYDFKKHLLNKHYIFDDRSVKRNHNLSDKLNHKGTCLCGKRFWASDWIDTHILTTIKKDQCPLVSADEFESRKASY